MEKDSKNWAREAFHRIIDGLRRAEKKYYEKEYKDMKIGNYKDIKAPFLYYLIKAPPSLSKTKKKAVLSLLYSLNVIDEADIDNVLSSSNLGIKNKEKILAESKNYEIMLAYDSLPPNLQDLLMDIEASEERGKFVEIQSQIAKLKDGKEHYPLSKKSDTDLSGEPADNITKICNILIEIENEIKRINKKIISVESYIRKISVESNIMKMEGKTISQKIRRLDTGIEWLSDLSTDIYKILKTPSISTKEAQGVGLPISYIISLSLSTAVTIFCGTSLYINIFTAKTLFDPYLSLFWFLRGIGIGLISLKGIFDWSNK